MHVMIDLETFGNGPRAALVEIAAHKFDPETGEWPRDFFWRRITWRDVTRYGETDGDTIAWWLQQDEHAIKCLTRIGERVGMARMLNDFIAWFPSGAFVWAKGPTFDLTILRHAYSQLDIKPPWRFFNERCVRTVLDLGGIKPDDVKFIGTEHCSVDDAAHQVRQVMMAYRRLGFGPRPA